MIINLDSLSVNTLLLDQLHNWLEEIDIRMEIFINQLEKPQIFFSLETIISNDISYNEGTSFEKFVIDNISFSVGLCGDLWDESNVEAVSKCCADVVLWPVYLDYSISKWNESEKREYALHAKRFGKIVLLINSICDGESKAKGTSAFFSGGIIIYESSMGSENILVVEV